MTYWITDRQPTEADGDKDGDVFLRSHPRTNYMTYMHWSHVGPGIPWRHTTIWTPPAEPPATLDFKIGQAWRTRSRQICRIIGIDDHDTTYPIHTNFNRSHRHYPNGKSYLGDGDQDRGADLVELIKDVLPEPDPASEPPATVATPRRFVSIHRTIEANGSHTVDAIDDEGIAWWMVLADVPGAEGWHRLTPLPVRGEAR